MSRPLINYCFCFLAVFCIPGCVSHSYYLSPVNGNALPYHPVPMVSDSVKKAVYANGIYSIGAANENGRDQVTFGQLSLHATNQVGIIQFSYGGLLSLGAYNNKQYVTRGHGGYDTAYPYAQIPDTLYNIDSRGRFFGCYGFFGAASLVKSFHHGEWRILGVEANLQQEFGDYYDFRKQLKDSAADVIFRNSLSGTIGFYTEFVHHNRKGGSAGFKFGINFMTNPASHYYQSGSADILPLGCFSTTFHATRNQYTGFMQLNLGTFIKSFQLGFTYQLMKKNRVDVRDSR